MNNDVDDFIDDDDDQAYDQGSQRESRDLRQLRKKAKEYDTVVKERDTAKRDLEFYRAGIPDTPAAKYFRKGYDGDPTPEAIRAAAVEAGILQESQTDEEADEDEVFDALDRVAAASNGASPTSVAQVTPATYAGWPRDRRLAFMDRHPDLTEALSRGESVKLPAAF